MLSSKQISEKILLIEADSEWELALAFLRFSEYYENPHFKDKIFTLDEFISWHKEQHGHFDYTELWGGFNVPGNVFSIFKQGAFDPLSVEEQALLSLLPEEGDYYVIGVGDSEALPHELAHAFYYLDLSYRGEADSLIASMEKASVNNFKEIRKELEEMGYHTSVWKDEMQAYATESFHNVPLLFHIEMRLLFKHTMKRYRISL